MSQSETKTAGDISSARRVFVADLGGTHLRSAVVDQAGEIHFHAKQHTPIAKSGDDIVNALVAAVRDCDRQNKAAGYSIDAISVVAPGTVNVAAGSIVKAPNLPFLSGFNLAEAVSRAAKLPAILENDANAAAVGEMWLGAARGRCTIVCVTLGTGVGGGIILDGKLWHGVNDSAAEIGHMCVDPFGGVACTCGSRGCLEVYASATAIVRMTREAKPRYPNSRLQIDGELTSESIYSAGVDGDELALEVFRRMGVYLGIGLANLINILNPEMIVVGGGVVNGWDLFEKHMKHEVVERAFPLLADLVKILPAKCGDDAGLLGAAKLAFDREVKAQ
jgi:glucokinase